MHTDRITRDDPEIRALIDRAQMGSPWQARANQAGLLAGRFTGLVFDLLEFEFGYSMDRSGADKGWIREHIRIPFYNWVFAGARYGPWQREDPIYSGTDLTVGEASALIDFVSSDGGYETVMAWIKDWSGVPVSRAFDGF
jgi:hypothetical protein